MAGHLINWTLPSWGGAFMKLQRPVPHFARQSGGQTFTATPVAQGDGMRRPALEGACGRRVASIPARLRPNAPAQAGWSKHAVDTALLVMMGSIALALGLTVYLTDRNASHAVLIPGVAALAGSNVFGALGQWLPAAVHPFAFGLFTAAVLPPRSAWRYGACAAWCVVNLAFELGQHPLVSGYVAGALQAGSGQSVPGRMLANYFLHGTFDGADMLAAVLGAVAAAAVLRRMQQVQEIDHA